MAGRRPTNWLLLGVLGTTAPAGAQAPTPESRPASEASESGNEPADPSAAGAATATADTTEPSSGTAPEAGASNGASARGSDAVPGEADPEPPPLPPPPEPRADEQYPPMYHEDATTAPPRRDVDLGPMAGVWWRPSEDPNRVAYGAGFVWGAYARVEPAPWLGLRAVVLSGAHPVTLETGAIGPTDESRVLQDDLSIILLSLQVEPTWVVMPELRLWGAAGIGWGTVVAEAPEAQNASLHSARRTGVLLELSAALGVTVDLIPSWLTASAMLGGGLSVKQTGKVFDERVQALRQPDATTIEYYEPLPRFAGNLTALAAVGIVP